jgi:hypothetical protein
MTNVWAELAAHFHEVASTAAKHASPPVQRGKVLDTDPLTVELDDDEVISEDDDDVEVDPALDDADPPLAVGDRVRVHLDAHHDFIISGRIRG